VRGRERGFYRNLTISATEREGEGERERERASMCVWRRDIVCVKERGILPKCDNFSQKERQEEKERVSVHAKTREKQ